MTIRLLLTNSHRSSKNCVTAKDRIAEVEAAIDELIKRHNEAATEAALSEVRRRLRIFIEQNRALPASAQKVFQPFISAVRATHARTVWASTRRKGGWHGLEAYHLLGTGTVITAQSRSQGLFSGLDVLLENMLGDDQLTAARDFLNELRRTAPGWRENFLKIAMLSGREVYRAELFTDDLVWDQCDSFWGGGGGYRDRVAQQLESWFQSHSHLESTVEKQVQHAWRESFLMPLAALSESLDLFSTETLVPTP